MATPAQNSTPQVMGIFLARPPIWRISCSPLKRVNHAAGAEEQQRFEERVRHQVQDAGRKCAGAEAQEHVAQLRNGRVGEDLLNVVLREADGGGEERGGEADDRDDIQRERRVQINLRAARDHVDAGGDHGGGVDQRGDRRGAGHRVGQPDVERNLRRFSGRADQQQQAMAVIHPGLDSTGASLTCAKTLPKSSVPK